MRDKLLYGGDYNPEQWMDRPDILKKDLEYLKMTGCNTVTLGVFSWSALETEEGVFRFEWLEDMIDSLYREGISTILATPSGARPRWLAQKYPEVLRVDERRVRQLYGKRHNHCFTSPVYREKTALIDKKLSERFGRHPGVIMWHISNEFSGECHCPLCQEAFKNYLKEKYKSIDELNRCWWTSFWSHTYDSFDQIESPSPCGEDLLHGLNLDWKRFVTEQTASFMRNEIAAVRSCSDRPVTANLMYYFKELDYFALAKDLDVVSWDTYPTWHKDELEETARDNALWHDMMRSLKRRPFLMMESCPSSTNWQSVSKLKRPGVLKAQALQAIAHGADGAMYFQIRQSRGASEKFHGALIDHYGGPDTRVLREAADTGHTLEKLRMLEGAVTCSKAAIVYDWNSLWAMEDAQGPRNTGLHYKDLLLNFYNACKDHALDVDFVDETVSEEDLGTYKVLILPMVYQFRPGFAEKVRTFTENGGVLVTTFWTGVADGTDLCFEGAIPHDLTDVLRVRSTEIDGLYDWEENILLPVSAKAAIAEGAGSAPEEPGSEEAAETEGSGRFGGGYHCRYLCDLVELRGAKPVLIYGQDFYKGMPALTVNHFKKGEAWYLAAHAGKDLCYDLLSHILAEHEIETLVSGPVPDGLDITSRRAVQGGEAEEYLIFQNFGKEPVNLPLQDRPHEDILGDSSRPLAPCETAVVRLLCKKQ